jgi:hypothetical protein
MFGSSYAAGLELEPLPPMSRRNTVAASQFSKVAADSIRLNALEARFLMTFGVVEA